MIITHPFKPVYDSNSKVLILGSFPSVKSREENFYYGNKHNRFWHVLSDIFAKPLPESTEEKKQLLLAHGIALWDVIKSCSIVGSADDTISDVVPNDILSLINDSSISAVYCNGSKAYSLYNKFIKPALEGSRLKNTNAVCLPSTSPANAAWSLKALTASYRRITVALSRSDYSTPYYSLSEFGENFYKKKLYRLSLDGGFTCPNRDGKIDTRGCIFCDGGSGYFAGERNKSISEQLKEQKALIKNKLPRTKVCGNIAYFQAFTGTYADIAVLREKYMQAISDPDIDILSIATRPDCLDNEVLQLLSEINSIKPVWIELGLQTTNKKTAEYIRRGYELRVYDKAVKNLFNADISQIIVHLIIGLPNENDEVLLKSLEHVISSGATGIKLQLLHVLKDTDLAADYARGDFKVLSLEQYLQILKKCIKILPPDIVIHRLTGDGSKSRLIAPLWSADKKHVINSISQTLREDT